MSSFFIDSQTSRTTRLQVNAVAGQALSVSFDTLPGNLPETYDNYLVVFQNSNFIPYNNPDPAGFQKVTGNTQGGSTVIQDVVVRINVSYIVGYMVGPKLNNPEQLWGNVASTVFIPEVGEPGSPFTPEISDVQPGPNSVFFRYSLPPGHNPSQNGAWVGIWNTTVASYGQPPIASAAINLPSSQGNAGVNDVPILRGQAYTIALFTSGFEKELVDLTFKRPWLVLTLSSHRIL